MLSHTDTRQGQTPLKQFLLWPAAWLRVGPGKNLKTTTIGPGYLSSEGYQATWTRAQWKPTVTFCV